MIPTSPRSHFALLGLALTCTWKRIASSIFVWLFKPGISCCLLHRLFCSSRVRLPPPYSAPSVPLGCAELLYCGWFLSCGFSRRGSREPCQKSGGRWGAQSSAPGVRSLCVPVTFDCCLLLLSGAPSSPVPSLPSLYLFL